MLTVVAALLTFGVGLICRQVDAVDPSDRAHAWLITRELAPGDRAAMRVGCSDGIGCHVESVAVQLLTVRGPTSKDATPVWDALDAGGGAASFEVAIPEDIVSGPVVARLVLAMSVRTEVERVVNTVYYHSSTLHDELRVPLVIMSANRRTASRWMFRALAACAWLVAMFAVYWIRRYPLGHADFERRLPATFRRFSPQLSMAFWGAVLVALVAVGHFAFVLPIGRTVEHSAYWIDFVLAAGWGASVSVGLVIGALRGASDLRWVPVKLRSVVGPPIETSCRTLATSLPAELARDAAPQTRAQLRDTVHEIGCTTQQHRNWTVVLLDHDALVRWRPMKPEPWCPEDLAVEVANGIDPAPLIACLSNLYGPLELRAPRQAPRMVLPGEDR